MPADAHESADDSAAPGEASPVRADGSEDGLIGRDAILHEIAQCRAAMAADPKNAVAHHDLGLALAKGGDHSLAILHMKQALRLQPGQVASMVMLGVLYDEVEDVDAARDAFTSVIESNPDDQAMELRRDAIGPKTQPSNAAIDQYLDELDATLDRHLERGPQGIAGLAEPELLGSNAFPRFALSYLGRDIRPVLEKWGSIFAPRFAEEAGYEAPGSGLTDRTRVGLFVSPGHEGLVATRRINISNRLDPERFETIIFCGESAVDRLSQLATSPAVSVRGVTNDLDRCRTAVRDARCDVISFRECGTDALNYFLAFSRLAPVQALEKGTPYTSGVPTFDHYLSSSVIEPEGADAHYVEELVRFNEIPHFEPVPSLPEVLLTKADLGFAPSQPVIVFAQNPLKMHPDLDGIVADALRAAPQAILLCFEKQAGAVAKVKQRMARTIPDVVDRIHWVRAESTQEYYSLLALADVCIDPPHYSGMNITFDTFAVGTPVISAWGEWMRSRFTAPLAEAMDLPSMVADSPAEIGQLAARLVNAPDELAEMSAQIVERRDVIFERAEVVADHENYFEWATRSPH